MKIALVLENADPARGGAEGWTFELARRLAARGHEVHVVAERFTAEALQEPIVPHALGRQRRRAAFAAAAEAKLRTLPVDVIHDMGAGWHGDVFLSHDGSRLALWERKLARWPMWLRPMKRLFDACSPRGRDFRAVIERQFAAPWTFVAISRSVAGDFRRLHHTPADRIRVIYNGVDTKRFAPERCAPLRSASRASLGIAADEVVFLFVGHDFARKGLGTAIRALARLQAAVHHENSRPARLLVVGGRRGHRSYARLAARLGVAACVTFAGAQRDPLPYYAAADALLLPTLHDPFGLVVLEAAACGKPVIVSSAAGASELIEPAREGFVVGDAADEVAFAGHMSALMDDAARAQMGAAARTMALGHPFERNCEQLLALYASLARRRAAA